MRNNRKAALFLTDNWIPVYEGDIVKVFVSKNGRTNIHWHPRSCDYKDPDTTRLAGKSRFIRLKLSEYTLLENAGRLTLILCPNERTHIYWIAPEKRKPLLRIPKWGLPPRWV